MLRPSTSGTSESSGAGERGGALELFLRSVRRRSVLSHEEVLELSRRRNAEETALRQALYAIPEVADSLLALWTERKETGRVTGVLCEDAGEGSAARSERVDRAFEAIAMLREQARSLPSRARIGIETQIADQLRSAELSLDVLVEAMRPLESVRGARARAALARAEQALEAWRDVRGRLVQHNLRLVVNLAVRFQRSDVPLMDLVQEGVIGLVRAAEKFDPERGFRFSTYAVWWIEQALIRAVQKQSRAVRLPAHVYEQQVRYRRIARELGSVGLERAELAEHLGLSTNELDQIEATFAPIRSLEATGGDEESGPLVERIVDPDAPDPADAISRGEIRSVLAAQLRSLEPREVTILSQRYGLDGGAPQTLEQVGATLGLSRERVRQIERQILDRLRAEPSVSSLAEAAR